MKIFCIGRNYVAHAKELGNDEWGYADKNKNELWII